MAGSDESNPKKSENASRWVKHREEGVGVNEKRQRWRTAGETVGVDGDDDEGKWL